MNQESQKSTVPLILIAIIGSLATIIAATIGAIGNYNIEKLRQASALTLTSVSTFESLLTPSLTPSPTQSQPLTRTPRTITPIPKNIETQVPILQTQIAVLEYEATQQSLNESDITTLRNNQKSLDSRFSIIEQAVLDNPEKSLELTLMRKEIDSIKEANKLYTEQTTKVIDRLYTQNNWFLGLIFTMALSLVSLAVSNFLKKPEQTDKRKRENLQSKK